MASFKAFEEIVAWQKARVFCSKVFAATRKEPFSRDFELRDQVNRSSGSIMDNIAEGFGRGGTKEFITFLSYARGSSDEARSQLYRALDRGYIDDKTFEDLKNEALIIGKTISGLMKYLQNTDIRGSKFLEPLEPYSNPGDPDNL